MHSWFTLSCIALVLKGDEIIVPAMTHVATAHAVELTGAKAVIADVDYITGNLNLENIKKITKRTKGIILVHMAGIACKLDEIVKLSKKLKLTLIEDCAHGLGTIYQNKHVGNFGITGCFSFIRLNRLLLEKVERL